MPLQMNRLDNGRVRLQFENRVSVWNILKFLGETPYLKHFIIENYEGGNTLVPQDIWKDEGIMFREQSPSVFLFPYDSIGFILDDSIHNLKLTMLNPSEEAAYQTEFELVYSVHNTDEASVIIPEELTSMMVSLYVLSIMKIGFDRPLLEKLETLFKGFKFQSLEYISASLVFGIKETTFLLKVIQDNDPKILMVTYNSLLARKDFVKEEDTKNIGLLKSRLMNKNKFVPYIYNGLLIAIAAALFFFNIKILVLVVIGLLIVSFIYTFIKKNAYKTRKKQ